MSLITALSNAVSGLAVAQHALSVTAGNVANVNTEGYTRKLARQEAVIVEGRGAGARALSTTRAVDEFLATRLRDQASRLGRSEVLHEVSGQVQDRLFGAPGEVGRGFAAWISDVAAAAEALAGGPGEPALAGAFIGAVQGLLEEIGAAGAEVQSIRHDLDRRIGETVGKINEDLRALDALNDVIARNTAGAELLDRQDKLLESLAGRIEIAVFRHDDNTVALYTRAGQPLLEHAPCRLVYEPAATVGSNTGFSAFRLFADDQIDPATGMPLAGVTGSVLVTAGVRSELTPELIADSVADASQQIVSPFQAGRLQGLLEARDRVLPAVADQLGELAGLARFALNGAHNAATPYPPPSRLLGTRTDTATFVGAARSGTATRSSCAS